MLNIFVCEDNAAQRQTVINIIQNTVLIEELDMQLSLDTGDPYMLLEKVKTSRNTGIYFLDIDLNSNMNGMKLAQQIRLYDPPWFHHIHNSTFRTELYDFSVSGRGDGFCIKRQPCRSESETQRMSIKCYGTTYAPNQQDTKGLYP